MGNFILHCPGPSGKVRRQDITMDEDVLKGKTLLVVDDETDLRDIVASELEFMGAKVFQAENISVAQNILNQEPIDLIVSDIRMPGGTGIDLLDIVKAKDENVPPVILITGFADITLEDAFNKGAEALLNKPFKLDDLIKLVVRYTSPFEMRFQEPGEPTKTLKTTLNVNSSHLGRGGLALPVDTEGKKYEIGETLSFDIEIDNQHYTGTGICRWFKPHEQGSNQAVMGLEFLSLTKDTLDQFMSHSQGKKIIPYIPSLNS